MMDQFQDPLKAHHETKKRHFLYPSTYSKAVDKFWSHKVW